MAVGNVPSKKRKEIETMSPYFWIGLREYYDQCLQVSTGKRNSGLYP